MSIKHHLRIAIIASTFTLIGMLFAHLALTDIGRLEPDVSGEWAVVQAYFGLLLLTLMTDLWLLVRLRRWI